MDTDLSTQKRPFRGPYVKGSTHSSPERTSTRGSSVWAPLPAMHGLSPLHGDLGLGVAAGMRGHALPTVPHRSPGHVRPITGGQDHPYPQLPQAGAPVSTPSPGLTSQQASGEKLLLTPGVWCPRRTFFLPPGLLAGVCTAYSAQTVPGPAGMEGHLL